MKALQIAATGMSAQQMRVEVISNNLSNMSTTGYNARRIEFSDLLYHQVAQPGTITSRDGSVLPTGVQIGLGVRPTSVSITLAQGGLSQTGRDLDLAIDGKGYFEVALPDGRVAFTRDGGMKRSPDGLVLTSDGNALVPEIVIPNDAISISVNAAGEVFAYFNDRVDPEEIGQITLVGFANPMGLEAVGSNLFVETSASGGPNVELPGTNGLGTVRQGYLEESSVDAVREITELIEAQRGYELNAKVITAADQMLAATAQIK
ncbi:MAG: flagellar basal-body rod protein FlgG [Pseudomonadota bacterium]